MSAYRFWSLTCDSCGEIYDPGTARTSEAVRRGAALDGWVRTGRSGDTCGRCVKTAACAAREQGHDWKPLAGRREWCCADCYAYSLNDPNAPAPPEGAPEDLKTPAASP